MNPIEGKIILVTGAGRGLAAAICKTLSAGGGTTILTDIQPEGLEKTLREINGQGCNARSFVMDVGDEKSVEEVIMT